MPWSPCWLISVASLHTNAWRLGLATVSQHAGPCVQVSQQLDAIPCSSVVKASTAAAAACSIVITLQRSQSSETVPGDLYFVTVLQGVDETSSRLPEVGDHSVRNGNAQLRASLFAHLSQEQLAATAPHQQEVGGLVRGASDAAVALQLAQVSWALCHVSCHTCHGMYVAHDSTGARCVAQLLSRQTSLLSASQ